MQACYPSWLLGVSGMITRLTATMAANYYQRLSRRHKRPQQEALGSEVQRKVEWGGEREMMMQRYGGEQERRRGGCKKLKPNQLTLSLHKWCDSGHSRCRPDLLKQRAGVLLEAGGSKLRGSIGNLADGFGDLISHGGARSREDVRDGRFHLLLKRVERRAIAGVEVEGEDEDEAGERRDVRRATWHSHGWPYVVK